MSEIRRPTLSKEVIEYYRYDVIPKIVEAELVAYERDILPQKIKVATDKLDKQWKHALSKSNRRAKAIAARDKWWAERLILAERKCRDLKCEYYRECGCIDSFGGNLCIWWQQLKNEMEAKHG